MTRSRHDLSSKGDPLPSLATTTATGGKKKEGPSRCPSVVVRGFLSVCGPPQGCRRPGVKATVQIRPLFSRRHEVVQTGDEKGALSTAALTRDWRTRAADSLFLSRFSFFFLKTNKKDQPMAIFRKDRCASLRPTKKSSRRGKARSVPSVVVSMERPPLKKKVGRQSTAAKRQEKKFWGLFPCVFSSLFLGAERVGASG